MNIEFVYYSQKSRYSHLECYSVYDLKNKELIYDSKNDRTEVILDRKNKIIYFMGMEANGLWILEKGFYFKIIKEFLKNEKRYNCENYTIDDNCTGGQIYYKYK